MTPTSFFVSSRLLDALLAFPDANSLCSFSYVIFVFGMDTRMMGTQHNTPNEQNQLISTGFSSFL
jgi:hypothetical protein